MFEKFEKIDFNKHNSSGINIKIELKLKDRTNFSFDFKVDTGSDVTIVGSSIEKSISFKEIPIKEKLKLKTAKGILTVRPVIVDEFNIGKIKIKNVIIYIAEDWTSPGMSDKALLGLDILKGFYTVLAIPSSKMLIGICENTQDILRDKYNSNLEIISEIGMLELSDEDREILNSIKQYVETDSPSRIQKF